MHRAPTVRWNSQVRLFLPDVDQTIADDFMPADPEMVREIDRVVEEGGAFFFVTGGPLKRLKPRLLDSLQPRSRSRSLVAHCNGAEIWGFDENGAQRSEPFYSKYDELMNDRQKQLWRTLVAQLVDEFQLTTYDPQPLTEFRGQAGDDPLSIIIEDRGPQITLEVVNGYGLSDSQRAQVRAKLPQLEEVMDLREPLLARANELFGGAELAVEPRLAGVFALDLALRGISKTEAVTHVMAHDDILQTIGLNAAELADPQRLEIWGDRFDRERGGDWRICAALDPGARAIDFRREDPACFPEGYNIVVWDGAHELERGALEFLQSRHSI